MSQIAEGIYQIYNNDTSGLRPLGVASINGGAPQVVELLPGTTAPLWTVSKVADGIFTFTVGGAFASPSGTWVAPSSTAYGWRVTNAGGNTYTVQNSNATSGWAYLSCVSIGVNTCNGDQPRIYMATNYAGVPWAFNKVA